MNDIDAALRHFKKVDPILYSAAKTVRTHLDERPRVKSEPKLFAALCESVVSQQLSVKAADTIWKRLVDSCGGVVTPESIQSTPLSRLRNAGLSAAKAKTLKALAKAVKHGLHLPSLAKKTPEDAARMLTAVWGIGPWTAEMFLMFGLHHKDIFSSRDLGLVRSMEALYGLQNPSVLTLERIARAWSPYRTVACRVLWRTRDLG